MGKRGQTRLSAQLVRGICAAPCRLMRRTHLRVFWIFLLSIALSSCITLNDPESAQEDFGSVVVTLEPGHTAGQTFISRRRQLNGVTLWLSTPKDEPAFDGELILQLFHQPGDQNPLYVVTIPLSASGHATPIEVRLPPQSDPPGQSYYLSVLPTAGRIQVLGSEEDAYPSGEAYWDKMSLPGDIAFRLSYDYNSQAVIDDSKRVIGKIWLLLPLAGVMLLPGWFLLSITSSPDSSEKDELPERIALTIGLSLALIPLLMLWTTQLRLPWSRTLVLFGAGAMLAVSLLKTLRTRLTFPHLNTYSLWMMVVFAGALAVRLIMVRDLVAPAWVDSVHHGLITRLIMERGGYPESYLPYLEAEGYAYHPGFHSLLATFLWLSKLDMRIGMLLLGQVLNACSVFAVYLFAKTLTGERLAGLVAALITAFFTPMPAYYASWGRFTQLGGILLLPVAFALIKSLPALQFHRNYPWNRFFLAAVACAGLFLMHYRVAVFFACLLVADFIIRALGDVYQKLITPSLLRLHEYIPFRSSEPLKVVTVAGASILLLLPWLDSMVSAQFGNNAWIQTPISEPFFSGFAWAFLTSAQGTTSLYLAGAGLLLSLWRKPSLGMMLSLWVGLLMFLANLDALGWMHSFINNLSVEISLFMPIAVLGGYAIAGGIDWLANRMPNNWRKVYFASLAIAAVGLCWYAARQLIPILNPITFLTRQADIPALDWIQENIPQDETILINPFPWGYGLFAGYDGGYWITPISGQRTIPPPVLYGFDIHTDRISHINQVTEEVIDLSADSESLHGLLSREKIGFIYIGARGGVLSPSSLVNSNLFTLLYNEGGTWVFQVK